MLLSPFPSVAQDYLIVTDRWYIDHIGFEGGNFQQIRVLFNGNAVGIDFHYQ